MFFLALVKLANDSEDLDFFSREIIVAFYIFVIIALLIFSLNFVHVFSSSKKITAKQKKISLWAPLITIISFVIWLLFSTTLDRQHTNNITTVLGLITLLMFISSLLLAVLIKLSLRNKK